MVKTKEKFETCMQLNVKTVSISDTLYETHIILWNIALLETPKYFKS